MDKIRHYVTLYIWISLAVIGIALAFGHIKRLDFDSIRLRLFGRSVGGRKRKSFNRNHSRERCDLTEWSRSVGRRPAQKWMGRFFEEAVRFPPSLKTSLFQQYMFSLSVCMGSCGDLIIKRPNVIRIPPHFLGEKRFTIKISAFVGRAKSRSRLQSRRIHTMRKR